MTKIIKVISFGKKNPNQLFAIGKKEREYYFINPPKKGREKEYFDRLYSQVRGGKKIRVEANIDGIIAELIPPSDIEIAVEKNKINALRLSGQYQ